MSDNFFMKNTVDFLIIGAMKCGTTSLHDYLGKHPDIFTTTPKEIHFFTNDLFDQNYLDDYFSNFKTDRKISGSSPQNYSKRHLRDFSGVPERLYKYLPNVKIIYIVRDPIKRIISHFKEAQEGGYAPRGGLNYYLKNYKDAHYVKTSMYYFQLQAYLKYFSMDQIYVVESERLKTDRLETLNVIFDFLGQKKLNDESIFNFETNLSKNKLKYNLFGRIIFNSKINRLKNFIPPVIRNSLKNKFIFKNSIYTPVSNQEIEPALEIKIREYLSKDVKQLRLLTGQQFNSWSL